MYPVFGCHFRSLNCLATHFITWRQYCSTDVSPSDVSGQQSLPLSSWSSSVVTFVNAAVVFLPNVHIFAVFAALNQKNYISLFMSGCFVLTVDKFLPQCIGGFKVKQDMMFIEDTPADVSVTQSSHLPLRTL